MIKTNKNGFYTRLILIIVVIFNLFLINKLKNIREYYYIEKRTCIDKEQDYISDFQRDLELMSQDICIDKDSIFNANILLTPKLIFVYSGNDCEPCIFNNMTKIKEIIGERIERNLIVFPILKDSRNNRIALEANFNGVEYKRLGRCSNKCVKLRNYKFFNLAK